MDIKDILVLLDAGEPDSAALAIAASLAKSCGACASGVCLYGEPEPPLSDCYAIGLSSVADVLERRTARISAEVAPAEAAFRKALSGVGLVGDWVTGEVEECVDALTWRTRVADLVVASAPADHAGPWRRLVELLVLSGAPCLLIPRDGPRRPVFDRIVLAWNGSAQARRALDDSLLFLKRALAVTVVIAAEEPTAWIDGPQSDAVLRHLAHHGVQADVLRVAMDAGRAGEALLRASADCRADLLVMGAYSHTRAVEMILGGATRTVLSHSANPVLLSR